MLACNKRKRREDRGSVREKKWGAEGKGKPEGAGKTAYLIF
jgi:hypothetical protein